MSKVEYHFLRVALPARLLPDGPFLVAGKSIFLRFLLLFFVAVAHTGLREPVHYKLDWP